MKLREYLDKNGMKISFFAGQIGVTRQQISGWLSGYRNPNRQSMMKIEQATKGKVKPKDWVSDLSLKESLKNVV